MLRFAFNRTTPGSRNHQETDLDRSFAYVPNLPPEFNDTKNVKGTVSMARGDDPASADTSFFISFGPNPALDGKYTAFARVADGLAVVETIENVPVSGETPQNRVEVRHVRIERTR